MRQFRKRDSVRRTWWVSEILRGKDVHKGLVLQQSLSSETGVHASDDLVIMVETASERWLRPMV